VQGLGASTTTVGHKQMLDVIQKKQGVALAILDRPTGVLPKAMNV